MKVFINVCEHEEVPIPDKKKGNKKWPVMVLGGVFRESVDKAAETCLVLDVIVNPSIIQECNADKSGETKEEVCVRVIDALRAREKERTPDGPPGGVLDKTFSLPKLSKVRLVLLFLLLFVVLFDHFHLCSITKEIASLQWTFLQILQSRKKIKTFLRQFECCHLKRSGNELHWQLKL